MMFFTPETLDEGMIRTKFYTGMWGTKILCQKMTLWKRYTGCGLHRSVRCRHCFLSFTFSAIEDHLLSACFQNQLLLTNTLFASATAVVLITPAASVVPANVRYLSPIFFLSPCIELKSAITTVYVNLTIEADPSSSKNLPTHRLSLVVMKGLD